MKLKASIQLALRYLGVGSGTSESNARNSLYGAIAGIGISLIPLITVLVVADGMIEGISSRIIELSTSHLRVTDFTNSPDSSEYALNMVSLTESVKNASFRSTLEAVWPERQGLGIAVGSKGRSGATIRATGADFFQNPEVKKLLTVISGVPNLSGATDAIIGSKLARDIGIDSGDTFRLLTMRTSPSGKNIPKFTTFKVRGVVSSGYQELDALWVFIPFETGCSILDAASSRTFISIQTGNAFESLEPLQHEISRFVPDGFYVHSWKELNRSQFQSFNTTRILLLFIMLLIVLIASVNVSSALVMMVMERRKEIAILKSMGATPQGISFSFIIAGFFTGLGGLVFGMPIGILVALHINSIFLVAEKVISVLLTLFSSISGIAMDVDVKLLDPAYYLQEIPVNLDIVELLCIAGGTLVLSVLVSILPAYRAGQEKPIEIMRKF
jgi:lipoprotein-releasing system permease protein